MPKADTPKRSRKGCTECRKRKIKCDEHSPTCGQCRKAGRDCPIVDSVFRLHPYTFTVQPEAVAPRQQQQQQAQQPPPLPRPTPARNWLAISSLTQPPDTSPPPPPTLPPPLPLPPAAAAAATTAPGLADSPQSQRFAPSSASTASPQASSLHSLRLPEDPQEANEVTFFLRQYCEGLGRRYFLLSLSLSLIPLIPYQCLHHVTHQHRHVRP